MPVVEKTALVQFSAGKIFALVDDIESYPRFLPWCRATQVQFRNAQTTVATITVDYHGFKQSFTTHNAKQTPHLIEMRLQKGPFRHLEGTWHFVDLDGVACRIAFRLDYEFSSRIMQSLFGPIFNRIASSMVKAFVTQAGKVYARR